MFTNWAFDMSEFFGWNFFDHKIIIYSDLSLMYVTDFQESS